MAYKHNFQASSKLHISVGTGHVGRVQDLLHSGECVNANLGNKITALHIAAQSGFSEIVDVLLKAGADVNCKDYENATPLILAAEHGNRKVIESLCSVKEINVNSRSSTNSTALHIASQNGHLQIVKLLLEKKANVNVSDNEGFIPLHIAIQQRKVEVSELLINNGANVNAEDSQKWTPLHNAAYNCFSLKIVKALLAKGSKVNLKINDGRGMLHLAAAIDGKEAADDNNILSVINCLIENGADMNALDNRKWIPLHCAAYDGNLETVMSLVSRKTNINAQTVKKTTPLHFAATNKHIKVLKFLSENGADVNAQDHTNWTPLHFAAEQGDDDLVEILLKNGADKSLKESQDGGTALHFAAQYARWKALKILVINGADVNARTNKNCTPLHMVMQHYGNLDIVRFLLLNGAYYNSEAQCIPALPLHIAEIRRNTEAITMIKLIENLFNGVENNNLMEVENNIKKGVIINAKNKEGKTPLYNAVSNGSISMVKLLLVEGADATSITKKGNTVLHLASSKGDQNIVEALLHHVKRLKPDIANFINAKTTEDNNTPLHVAVNLETVNCLLKYGAAYNIINKKGKTPLDLAKDKKICNILKLVDELFKGTENGDQETIKILKDLNSDKLRVVTSSRNDQEKTILQVALTNKHKDIADNIIVMLKQKSTK